MSGSATRTSIPCSLLSVCIFSCDFHTSSHSPASFFVDNRFSPSHISCVSRSLNKMTGQPAPSIFVGNASLLLCLLYSIFPKLAFHQNGFQLPFLLRPVLFLSSCSCVNTRLPPAHLPWDSLIVLTVPPLSVLRLFSLFAGWVYGTCLSSTFPSG